ncbi:flagellar basal body P-ring biosynthesis protein FlgA [Novipirellula galeiformis]|uniref:Flagellar basal body P-ring biosynthesis protein FlgA n=1 Tax=Novipirellula galeiformis TaxID=2528004 RepID=A0A5C6CKD0_9BACT|nr:flagellar basal body P-ring formation chaperone FlgA [Novipirellula galeiformis]TWU23914.1 flagellar basal body P-ring biosynthesis protein FlgA [Novipirellula galeiformis]
MNAAFYVRIVLYTLALVWGGSELHAQTGALVPVRKSASAAASQTTSIDQSTSWTFRMKGQSVVHSPIVRLGDVVVPLDPNTPGWSRLSRSAVGLVPLNGKAMRVDRDRLTDVILNADATPRRVYWVGPDVTEIVYDTTPQPASPAPPSATTIQQASYVQQADLRQSSHRIDPAQPAATTLPRANLDPSFADRLIQWIETAIQRAEPTLLEHYELSIDRQQPAMQHLELARGIERADFLHGVEEGECALRVVSRGLDGTIEVDLAATLRAHPIAVVPTQSFRSGHRLGPADLTSRPIPQDTWDDTYCTDPAELIGMETRGNLRSNQPISRHLVGMPMLVRRNDLVEVRVLNGSISVTTNAKALGEGAESELIEIETLQPRKRLVARVVSSGLVEIVTRAPRTQ